MEITIYKTTVELFVNSTDVDGCPVQKWEIARNEFFPTEDIAVQRANKWIDEFGINAYVETVEITVRKCIVDDNGTHTIVKPILFLQKP